MNKASAIHNFWSGFGLTAYEENTVPSADDSENAPAFPYLTYQVATGDIGVEIALSASLWYRSSSWLDVNNKARQIEKKIGQGGIVLPCDGGAMWIKRGTPFAQNMSDPDDDAIRRKFINISVEFFTAE
jgi:hypothetical protein